MKKILFIFLLLSNLPLLFSQDEITGVWLNKNKDAKIETYKCSIQINSKGKLRLTGHWGPFSETEEWQKVK